MSIESMVLLGKRVLVKKLSGEYSFSESESVLLIPKGYDLNLNYTEGIVEQVSSLSMCKVGDRVIYLESGSNEVSGKFIISDPDIVMIERA